MRNSIFLAEGNGLLVLPGREERRFCGIRNHPVFQYFVCFFQKISRIYSSGKCDGSTACFFQDAMKLGSFLFGIHSASSFTSQRVFPFFRAISATSSYSILDFSIPYPEAFFFRIVPSFTKIGSWLRFSTARSIS